MSLAKTDASLSQGEYSKIKDEESDTGTGGGGDGEKPHI
jgi:hypothetical protein